MDNRRIGLFDSGLGGLTVMKELMRLLPSESIVYFGDTGRIPYGSKSVDTILKYTKSDIRFLQDFDLKMMVAACGTASSTALPLLKGQYDVPLLGVIEPAAKAAAGVTKNGCVGVIGTAGTIASGAYKRLLAGINPDIQTVDVACPLFVHLVENGFAEKNVAKEVAEEYLEPIKKAGADTLILGCTHYPLLRKVITEVLGDKVTLINPGVYVAEEIKARLTEADQLAEVPYDEQYSFYVSDDPAGFVRLGSVFLERPISGLAKQVDIEQFTE
ncbi:MAG: glutamate racemase [Ruminococcaceae bacterium]|nr:glutamate racemase [Oscillospiraceae bacterium]